MNKRLIIYIILTLIAAGIFLFEPTFNFGGKPTVSLYAQSIQEGKIGEMIMRVLTQSAILFFGLVFLFGVKPDRSKFKKK
jgi:hypothetical protein